MATTLLAAAVLLVSLWSFGQGAESMTYVDEVHGSGTADIAAAEFPTGWDLLLRTFGSLLLVVILIFAVVFVLRRYVFNRNGLGNAAGTIKVLSSSFLGPKKSIHLVKVLNRVLVLGVSEAHIQTLSEFRAEEAERLLSYAVPPLKEQQPFSKIIASILGRAKDEPAC